MSPALWFPAFVNETVALCRTEFQPNPIPERRAAMRASEIGKQGEEFIAELLRARNYLASCSPGSRSPSDVWGLKKNRTTTHLPLIQVKSTGGFTAESLTVAEAETLGAFTQFVWDRFRASSVVPSSEKIPNLIVSAGYAGVQIVASMDRRNPGIKKVLLGAYYIENSSKDPDSWASFLEGFHRLK